MKNLLLFHPYLQLELYTIHLVKKKIRTSAGLVLESGDIRETQPLCTAIGYGVSAINPYLALESLLEMWEKGQFSGNSKTERSYFLITRMPSVKGC